ncbi:hypothetical protein [Achromobacter aegrifaciens]
MFKAGFDFNVARDPKVDPRKIITELQRIASNGSVDWIRPIVDVSFDAYAGDYLSKNKPQFLLFNPCRVEENLLEGSKLLDQCIARKHETLALESEAILAALDIEYAAQLAELEAQIADPAWLVANKKNGEQTPVTTPVQERKMLQWLAINARSRLYTTKYSSLNYAERIDHMRFLYTDTLRLCYERLYSAWIGLNRFFSIPTPIPPGPLSTDGKGTVEDITKWVRYALEQLEIGEKNERIEEHYFLASELVNYSDGVKSDFRSGAGEITVLLNSMGANTFGLSKDDYTIRMIGMGFSIATALPTEEYIKAAKALTENTAANDHLPFAFRYPAIQTMREFCSLTLQVEVPQQDWGSLRLPYLSPEQSYWKIPPVRIDGVQPWVRGNIKDAVGISNLPQLRNVDPAGQWIISVRNRVIIAGTAQDLKGLRTFPQDEMLQRTLDVAMENLVIGFRIAIRPATK